MDNCSHPEPLSVSELDASIDEHRLFDLLANERRRSTVRCLATSDGTITVQALASQVAEHVSDEECVANDIRDSVYVSLCQNHLPKLDEANVVDYESSEKVVGQDRAFPLVARHLPDCSASAPERVPNRYHVLASVATVTVLGAAAFGVSVATTYGVPFLIAVHSIAALALWREWY